MNSSEKFVAAKTYACAGASSRTHKYGYRVFKALLAADRETYPLNPVTEEIEGHIAYPKIGDLPIVPESLSIITPPEVTRQVIADAVDGPAHLSCPFCQVLVRKTPTQRMPSLTQRSNPTDFQSLE